MVGNAAAALSEAARWRLRGDESRVMNRTDSPGGRSSELAAAYGLAGFGSHAQKFRCTICGTLRRYEGNRLREEMALPLAESAHATFGGAEWHGTARAQPVAGREGTFDLDLTFAVMLGFAEAAGVGAVFDFDARSSMAMVSTVPARITSPWSARAPTYQSFSMKV